MLIEQICGFFYINMHNNTHPPAAVAVAGGLWRLCVCSPIYTLHVITTPTSTEVNYPHCLPVFQFAPLFWGCHTPMVEIGIRSLGCCISSLLLDRYLLYLRAADCTARLPLRSHTHIHTRWTTRHVHGDIQQICRYLIEAARAMKMCANIVPNYKLLHISA